MTEDTLAKIEAAAMAATQGRWRWELNRKSKIIQLCGGRPAFDLAVMDFVRWGMSGAAPRFRHGPHELLTRAEEFGEEVEGRRHHASWFQAINHPDANHIAMMDPTTTLELVEYARRLEGLLREARTLTEGSSLQFEIDAILNGTSRYSSVSSVSSVVKFSSPGGGR